MQGRDNSILDNMSILTDIATIIGRNYQSAYSSMVLLTDLSDHYPTMLEIPNLDIYKKQPKKIHTRKLDPLNITKINEKLQETDWETLLDNQDTELSYNIYQEP